MPTWFNPGSLVGPIKNWAMNTGTLVNLKSGWMNTGTLRKTFDAEIATTNWPTAYGALASNPYMVSYSTNSGSGPEVAMDGNTDWNNNAQSNGYNSLPWTWTIRFNVQVKYTGFTIHGWGQNDNWKASPKSFNISGSNDGSNWTSIYDTTAFPDSWRGDSWNYGWNCPSNSYSPSGPGAQSGTISNTGYYSYLRIQWRSNQADNSSAKDSRYCWANDPNWAYYQNAYMIALSEISFTGSFKPI